MFVAKLSTKGQLTLPRGVRAALRLQPGSKIRGSVDAAGRLVLVPDLYEPNELFASRPKVKRKLTLAQIDAAVVRGTRRGHL